jgi:hypothetical protein
LVSQIPAKFAGPVVEPLLLPPELVPPPDELELELEVEFELELELEFEPELELELELECEPVLPELATPDDPLDDPLPLLVPPPVLAVAPVAWQSLSDPQVCPAGHWPSGQL